LPFCLSFPKGICFFPGAPSFAPSAKDGMYTAQSAPQPRQIRHRGVAREHSGQP
jgi:hypothetical protein